MKCPDFNTMLQPYADGEADAREAAGITSHLAECDTCRNLVRRQREMHRLLRQAAGQPSSLNPRPSAEFQSRLIKRLNETSVEHIYPFPIEQLLPWTWPKTAAAAALILLTAGAALALSQSSKQTRREQRIVLYAKDSIDRHQRRLPVEVSGTQPQKVQNWLQGKVDFAARIPSNLNNKASLVGARLSNVRERQAAYFVYDAPDERRLSLFAFDAPDLEVQGGQKVDDCEVMLTNQQGYNVVIWKDKEIAYSLVSDLDEQDILELVPCDGDEADKPSADASEKGK